MTINVAYLDIQDCDATPSSYTWYADNSIDDGNNTGWNFVEVPSFQTNERIAEQGAVIIGQASSATPGTVSRLGGAGQIEADIVKIKADGVYTTRVSNLTARGRLINKALGY
jgi:hypothetical protein